MDRVTQSILTEFSENQNLANDPQEKQFELLACYSLLHKFCNEEFPPLDFVIGAGGDLGVDAAAIQINGDLYFDSQDVEQALQGAAECKVNIVIVQAKRSAHFESAVISDLSDNLCTLFKGKNAGVHSNPDIVEFKKSLDAVFDVIKKLRPMPHLYVYYVTTGIVGSDFLDEKRKAACARLSETNFFSEVDFELIGATELRDLYKGTQRQHEAHFTMEKKFTLPKMPGIEQAYSGVLRATDIVEMVTDQEGNVIKSLFFDNVRDFQGMNPVNRSIGDTIQTESRRQLFAVLNNGITMVTRRLDNAGDDFYMSDFQVVNGCQTCHVLAAFRNYLDERTYVNLRVIESKDEDAISAITEATNRQTAVSDDDLKAREEYQKDLEDMFNSFDGDEKLYFERRSQQYGSMSIEQTRIVNRNQLISAFAAMFLGEQHRAGRYTKKIREDRKEDLFTQQQDPLLYYTAAYALYRLEWLFRNGRIDRRYKIARYQLLAGMRVAIDGRNMDLPRGNRYSQRYCEAYLRILHRQADAERFFGELELLLDATVNANDPSRVLTRDLVKSVSFSDEFLARVARSDKWHRN
ncbi:hypothetical protein EFN05_00240 [Propionibacterium freudenreichii]|nr:AIPR family protein [Propionibacterium freudenreichii]MCT2974958.1 hypothetical protein [Propionibacterium freudenreichii]MCT2977164.1 hypothetical protein [Propionibacterium freudenreichii]MCT2987970.1 hypothetical protein [Propionibacterium freudenreichii]MCT2999077.1 hypothetical protein [Propionibacterium freudenreichii]MCT3001480.1 hypothetical protein [Propionibacterium freudenreichii]